MGRGFIIALDIKRTKYTLLREKHLIVHKNLLHVSAFLDHSQGTASNYKTKCIEIGHCMYQKATYA
jgi:hypothetical protein